MTLSAIRRASNRLHYAWVIVAVIFAVAVMTAGVRSTPGVLIVPLENEFGWTRATISFALGVNLLLFGAIGPFGAAVMDRFGARRTITLEALFRGSRVGLIGGWLCSVFLGQMAAGTCLGERPHALFIGGCAGSGSLIGLSVMLELPARAAMALMAGGWLLHGLTMVSAVVLLVGKSPGGRATILTLYGPAMSFGMALGAAFGGLALAMAGYFTLGVCTMALPIASAVLVSISRLSRTGAAAA